MIVGIDTNVFVYALGGNGPEQRAEAVKILRRLSPTSIVVPAQVIGELYGVLVRKVGIRPDTARYHVESLLQEYSIAPTTPTVLTRALGLTVMSKVSIWDSIVLATADEAGCQLLLS